MITVIAFNDFLETIIKRYDVNDIKAARDLFVMDWINGVVEWDNFEYHGKGCTVDNPAFTPAFLEEHGFDDEPQPEIIEGVYIYTRWCIIADHGSDEHYVNGHFIPTKDYE